MNNKKIIAEIITGLNVGGAEVMLYNYLKHINREKYEPKVISLIDGIMSERIQSLGIETISLNMRQGTVNIKNVKKLHDELKRIKPNLIHSWMYHANILSFLCNYRRVPIIWSIHGSLYNNDRAKLLTKLVIRMGAYLSKYPAAIHYVSKTSAIQHEKYGYKKTKTVLIPNGFDTDLFKPCDESKHKLCSELCIDDGLILIGLVTRNHPVKDHGNFLSAAALLIKQYPQVRFLIIGPGIQNKTLDKKIKELQLTNYVLILGQRVDMPYVVSALDIACSSSYSEAFPMTIGEAMSCGVPCVVTDVGDSALLVGDAGFAVPARNSFALAAALHKMILLKSDGRKRLGQVARARIQHFYSILEVANRYENLYNSFL